MIYIFEDCREGESEGETKSFKTLRGATAYGARVLKAYGHFRVDRLEGANPRYQHRVVAEWKDNGKLLGKVWV
jgi:hypothetical protein